MIVNYEARVELEISDTAYFDDDEVDAAIISVLQDCNKYPHFDFEQAVEEIETELVDRAAKSHDGVEVIYENVTWDDLDRNEVATALSNFLFKEYLKTIRK